MMSKLPYVDDPEHLLVELVKLDQLVPAVPGVRVDPLVEPLDLVPEMERQCEAVRDSERHGRSDGGALEERWRSVGGVLEE